MDDTSTKDRREYDRQGGKDRRRLTDRRSGIDRRGTAAPRPLSLEPRPYGFRDFDERRDRQDRRLFVPERGSADRAACDPPGSGYPPRDVNDDGFIHLSHEELLQLLSEFDR